MKTNDLLIRGYIRREEGQWVAVCLDFNLAAQAESKERVEQKIVAQIKDYIDEALGEDKAYASQLLTRRAPLSAWLRYYVYKTMFHFHQLKNACTFVNPIPMRTA